VEQASWESKKRGHQLQTIQTAAEIMFVCLGTVRLRRFVTNLLLGALQIFFIIIIIIIIIIILWLLLLLLVCLGTFEER